MGEIDEATPNLNILVHSESDGEAEQSTQLRRTIIYRYFPKGSWYRAREPKEKTITPGQRLLK